MYQYLHDMYKYNTRVDLCYNDNVYDVMYYIIIMIPTAKASNVHAPHISVSIV